MGVVDPGRSHRYEVERVEWRRGRELRLKPRGRNRSDDGEDMRMTWLGDEVWDVGGWTLSVAGGVEKDGGRKDGS